MDTMIRSGRAPTKRCASPAGRSRPTLASTFGFPWDNRLVRPACRGPTPELGGRGLPHRPIAYKPKLTRYQRQQILLKTAELLVARKEEPVAPDHPGNRGFA